MPTRRADAHDRSLHAGLFLLTASTLLLEIVSARLLSVVTWYHISFFAVSLAMLGGAAGAVTVFVAGERLGDPRKLLARSALAFAIAIPVCHALSVALPMPLIDAVTPGELLRALRTVSVLTAPFYLSGIAVTVALTRTSRPIGRLYAADLVGAAVGCLLVIPLLGATNVTAAAFAAACVAVLAAFQFYRFADLSIAGVPAACLIGLAVMTAIAATGMGGIGLVPGKGLRLDPAEVLISEWNDHSNIVALRPSEGPAFYWGPGEGADAFRATTVQMVVDGGAATAMTQWAGDRDALDWVRFDVTYLPYHLRCGHAAVIGAGGGRDLLSAIAGGCDRVTGIEVNGILVDLLQGPLRDFAGLATFPGVSLVHDEARSYLARTGERFDVVQMSLIDTWAATGAGAFALSENGLYTLEGWRLFLDVLAPRGILSVSRWFEPTRLSETNRLLALGAAALLDRGASPPSAHLVLVTRHNVATLLVSNAPFDAADIQILRAAADRYGFQILLAPGVAPPIARLAQIVDASSREEVLRVVADPVYDFTPPTDDRPYFFNMLRLGQTPDLGGQTEHVGVALGNIRATTTLHVLLLASVLLVAGIVLGPLGFVGIPGGAGPRFVLGLVYFAAIGFAYMLLQFGLLQRFSILLGHPTYSLVVVLFTMILFTGLGSALSDRIDPTKTKGALAVPAIAGLLLIGATLALPSLVERAIAYELFVRAAVVFAVTAPLAVLLGFCFPFGLRIVAPDSDSVASWMWGVNGAFSVLGSVCALVLSMEWGIGTTLLTAAALYLVLPPVLWRLAPPTRS